MKIISSLSLSLLLAATSHAFPDFRDRIPNGDVFLEDYEDNPEDNIAPCCLDGGIAACEALYLANANEPCGVDSDCAGNRTCDGGLCGGPGPGNGSGANGFRSSGAIPRIEVTMALLVSYFSTVML